MTQAQKLNTISSNRVFMRGCVFALFVTTALAVLSSPVKAEMILFWNFDEYTTEGGVNYVTDSVHSERLKLVNASIVDGQLSANGGYAQGTVEGTNGVNAALPLGSSTTPNYTLSAFLTSSTNATVGIMGWGAKGGGLCNCFRTTGNSGETTGGLNSYWWGNDVVVSGGYPEIYGGVENHVATTAVGNTHYLYLNGQLLLSDTKGARSEANQDFAVGKTVNNEQLKGSLDNASIYNEALEQSDIIRISTSKLNGLTNWWKSGTTVDRISGVVKPETVTGTKVINGANGDVMVFNRALESSEQTFYEGQLATGHGYVMNNLADSSLAKTTWFSSSSANLNDMTTVPLGIYVGGTTSASTLTATAAQLNSVNRTFVLGGGTLAISSDSDVSVAKNRVGFDSGSISTSGTGTITFNSSEKLSLKNVNLGTNSKLAFNSSDDMRVIGAVNLDANSALTIDTTGSVQTAGTVTLGANSAATFNAGDIVRAAGAITLNSGSAFTINTSGDIQTTGAINLGENSALTFNTPGNVRPTGAFAGKGDLVKSGTGNLFLTVKSTNHEGTLHVNGGTVTFSIQDVFGTADDFPKNSIVVDNAIVTNNAAVFNNLKDATFKNGAKIVAANGNRDWKAFMLTGTTNIAFSGDGTTAEAPVVFEVASSSTGDARKNATICPFGNTFNVADITKSADPDLIITAVLANANGTGKIGSFTKTGAGTLKLAAANTFDGDIDIRGGTVVMAYNAKVGGTVNTATALGNPSLAGRKITIYSGATLTTESSAAGIDVFGGADAYPKFRLIADGGTIATATNQLTTYGDIELKNGGTFAEKGGESYWKTIINGDVYVTQGDATISSTSSLGIITRGLRNGKEVGVTFDVADGSTLTVSALLSYLNTNVRNANAIIKDGKGTMILSNNKSNFTGNIVVDEGVLKATTKWTGVGNNKNTTVFGYYQSKTVTVNEGAEVILAAQDVVSDSSHSTPIQFILDGGKISNEGAVYNNLNNTVFKNGGELYASNGNDDWKAYKLSTKVSVLRDEPSAQPAKISSDLSKANATISFGNTTSLYIEDVTSASTDIDTLSDLIISAVITNPHTESNGTFYKDGTGILEFTASNSYNGTTSIREGVLRLSGAGSMGTSAVNLVTNGTKHGTLEFKDSTATIPSAISGAGDILVSSGTATITGAVNQTGGATTLANGTTLNIGSASATVNPMLNNLAVVDEDSSATLAVYGDLTLNNDQMTKFIGSITADTITKTGNETLKIYTGADGQVDAQSLVVSSGRLDLKGYMTDTITVNANAVFSPGNSIGEATYGGNYILNEGATLLFEIGGETVEENDSLYNKDNPADEGQLTIDGLVYLTLSSGSTFSHGDTFTAVLSGSNSGDDGFANNLLSHVRSYDFTDFEYVQLDESYGEYNGKFAIRGRFIDHNAIPEPSTWALLILGVAGLMYWRRRK